MYNRRGQPTLYAFDSAQDGGTCTCTLAVHVHVGVDEVITS